MPDLVGSVLVNRYHIIAEIGKGGMGRVYLAYDLESGSPVAIKTVPSVPIGGDNTLHERLRREGEALARLRHPNIVSFHEAIREDRNVFLVMDYVDGQNLDQILDAQPEGKLDLADVLPILRQVSWALAFAHQRGVYYRDLKPENILLDRSGTVHVVDFGTALVADLTRVTQSSGLIGTPCYAAPEQWLGQQIDARTDVYALGGLLYRLLTGQLPFSAGDAGVLMQQVFNEPPTPPREYNKDISPGVEQVILRALAKTREQRLPDVLALLGAFEAAARETSSATETSAALPAAAKPARLGLTPRDWLFLGVGANLALLIVLIWVVLSDVKAPGSEPAASVLACTATVTPTHTEMPTSTPTQVSVPTPTRTATFTPSATCTPSPTSTPLPTATFTPLPSPTPHLLVSVDQLTVYAGPGENYEPLGALRRGDRVSLCARSEDGTWWQVNYLGKEGWIRAQPVGASVDVSWLPTRARQTVPTLDFTPTPESAVVPANTRVELQNPGFAGITDQVIPGWRWLAYDNYAPEDEFDPETSFAQPTFKQADDAARWITGPTLQIDTAGFPKFRAFIYQTVNVPVGAVVILKVSARAYSSHGDVQIKAGIDPDGAYSCEEALWGVQAMINEDEGIVRVMSPAVTVGESGRATVCVFAETAYASAHQAAFLDDAELIMNPE